MTKRTWILTGALLLLACQGPAGRVEERAGGEESGEEESGVARSFATSTVHFEQNATDGDVEVVFAVKGGDEGLTALRIVSPDGRVVADFHAPDHTTLGMRQFRFESPEPGDVARLESAYPARPDFVRGAPAGRRGSGDGGIDHQLEPCRESRRIVRGDDLCHRLAVT